MIEILEPSILPANKVKSGITKKNIISFPDYGFSITKAEIYTDDTIAHHRQELCKYLKIEPQYFKIQKQIHSDIIRIIDESSNLAESDAMITDRKGVFINTSIADCAAVLLFAPDKHVIAGIHSGWKGTSLNIVSKTISKMVDTYQIDVSNLKAYISPCASGEKYEVEFDVAKFFQNSTKQISETKYLFDNKKEIHSQLLASGVMECNIEISPICTITDNNFHSYRRDKIKSGRMSAFIGMI